MSFDVKSFIPSFCFWSKHKFGRRLVGILASLETWIRCCQLLVMFKLDWEYLKRRFLIKLHYIEYTISEPVYMLYSVGLGDMHILSF